MTIFSLDDIADAIRSEPALWDRPVTPDDVHCRIAMNRAHLLIEAAIFLNLDMPIHPDGPIVITPDNGPQSLCYPRGGKR